MMNSVSTGPSPQEKLLSISINNELPNSNSSRPIMGTIIFFICVIALLILFFLPQENADRLLVPVLFKDQPTYYHMLLIFIGFAGVAAFGALIIEHMHKPMPKAVKALGIVAEASMLLALVIVTLLCAAALFARF